MSSSNWAIPPSDGSIIEPIMGFDQIMKRGKELLDILKKQSMQSNSTNKNMIAENAGSSILTTEQMVLTSDESESFGEVDSFADQFDVSKMELTKDTSKQSSPPALHNSRNKKIQVQCSEELEEIYDQLWVGIQRRMLYAGISEDETQDDDDISIRSIQSLVVTSWADSEGASSTALGIALRAASSSNARVCLIDADFHQGGMTYSSQLQSNPGLYELMCGQKKLDEVILPIENTNLDFIPSGINPDMNKLSSDLIIQNIISQLENRYRYVFYDASCLKRGIEAYRWGRFVVNSLLVVRAGWSRKQTVSHAINSMKLHGMEVMGMILNRRVDSIPNWLYSYI